jgi:TetR/AcrR family transcriptional regulator, cholesterol catabolism regulator
LYPNKR